VVCKTLGHHCLAPLLVDKSFKDLFNPIEMLLLGMPVLVVKVYYNIKLGSPPPPHYLLKLTVEVYRVLSLPPICSGQPVIGNGCHLFVMQSHSCLRICSDLGTSS